MEVEDFGGKRVQPIAAVLGRNAAKPRFIPRIGGRFTEAEMAFKVDAV